MPKDSHKRFKYSEFKHLALFVYSAFSSLNCINVSYKLTYKCKQLKYKVDKM